MLHPAPNQFELSKPISAAEDTAMPRRLSESELAKLYATASRMMGQAPNPVARQTPENFGFYHDLLALSKMTREKLSQPLPQGGAPAQALACS